MFRTIAAIATLGLACTPATPIADPIPVPRETPPQDKPAADQKSALYKERLASGLTPYLDALGSKWGEAFGFSGLVLVSHRGQTIYAP